MKHTPQHNGKGTPAAALSPAGLLNPGPEHLPDSELLARLLSPGGGSAQAKQAAWLLIERFGSIRCVVNASPGELMAIEGIGRHRAAMLVSLQEVARRFLQHTLTPGNAIQSPADSREYLTARLRDRPQEVFCAIFLDNRHRVLSFEELFFGTIDATTVYPREVLRRALRRNAAAVILAHNHPSGVAEPSTADQSITRRIRDALELIDVRLLDHFIIGDGSCVSLAARGMF